MSYSISLEHCFCPIWRCLEAPQKVLSHCIKCRCNQKLWWCTHGYCPPSNQWFTWFANWFHKSCSTVCDYLLSSLSTIHLPFTVWLAGSLCPLSMAFQWRQLMILWVAIRLDSNLTDHQFEIWNTVYCTSRGHNEHNQQSCCSRRIPCRSHSFLLGFLFTSTTHIIDFALPQ